MSCSFSTNSCLIILHWHLIIRLRINLSGSCLLWLVNQWHHLSLLMSLCNWLSDRREFSWLWCLRVCVFWVLCFDWVLRWVLIVGLSWIRLDLLRRCLLLLWFLWLCWNLLRFFYWDLWWSLLWWRWDFGFLEFALKFAFDYWFWAIRFCSFFCRLKFSWELLFFCDRLVLCLWSWFVRSLLNHCLGLLILLWFHCLVNDFLSYLRIENR